MNCHMNIENTIYIYISYQRIISYPRKRADKKLNRRFELQDKKNSFLQI